MNIKTLGIIGAGQMGNGIAQVGASIGLDIVMYDISEKALGNGLNTITKSCDRFIKKEIMTETDKQNLLSRIKTTTKMVDFEKCQIVIEAATENLDLKLKIFSELDKVTSANTILCSNTSSISITKIASATSKPQNVCGMHFMNPVPLMKLVEGIRGLQTSPETFETVKTLAEEMGKTFVVSKDMPGFIVNRILMPMINEAVYTFYEGIAEPEAIDSAMKLGTNQPMGPLALADFIGLDTCLAIMNVLHTEMGDTKYRPCPLLKKYVEAGWLGKKTGRGFYSYV